jgi:Tol biopolymer transport system component
MEINHEEARTMKTRLILLGLIAAILALALSGAGQQSAEQLYKAGLYEEEVGGDLQKAIATYQDLLKRFPDNREIAAIAQLHIGLCHEKLGTQEAEKAFQKVIDNYPEQSAAVNMAKGKLVAFQKARGATETGEGEFRISKIGAPDALGGPSPDGKLISCVDWDSGDLAVYDVAAGKLRRVTDKGSWAVSGGFAEESIFSPNGKSIAFNWFLKDRYILRTINIDGTGQRDLCGGEDIYYIWPCSWTPDARHILTIVTDIKMLSRIAMISASDGTARTIKEFKSGAPGKLSLSPDGRWIAFEYKNEVPWEKAAEKRDIYLLAVDGGLELPLVAHPADESLLGWTPDGKSVLFLSDRSGTRDAWIQPVEGGKPRGDARLVKRDFGDQRIRPLGFDKNGSFYYGVGSSQYNVYIVSLDPTTGGPAGRAEKAALLYEGSNGFPSWSADGDHLAYTSFRRPDGAKANVLVIKSVIMGEDREVLPGLRDFDTVAWFPDGESILCRAAVEGHRLGLFQVDLAKEKAETVLVLDDMGGLHGPILSPDGKRIIYDLDDFGNQTFRVMSFELETKQKRELIRSSSQIISYGLSPDGKWLAFKEGERGIACLRVIPSGGGEKKTILRLDKGGGINSIVWSPDGQYIYFSKWEKGSSKSEACSLWRIAAQGGEPVKYDLTMDGLSNLCFHPDGSKLAFNSWRIESEVWVMENFLPADKAKK